MRIAIIGRSEILYDTAIYLESLGHEIVLIITAKQAPEYTRTVEDFRALAEGLDTSFICTPNIEKGIDLLKELGGVDIGVSYNYVGVIPSSVIDLFPYGILNAHGGDLPRYRGNACQAWAIINNEPRIGLCVHYMIADELDSGNIVARDYFELAVNTKITEVHQWMTGRIPVLFGEALSLLSKDSTYILESQSADPRSILRCYPRRPEDGKIDWRCTNDQVLRLINASNKPYPGAFCVFSDRPMIIWDAETVHDNENYCAVAGQVIHITSLYIDVACGKGKLRIKSVEVDGVVDYPSVWIKSIRNRLL